MALHTNAQHVALTRSLTWNKSIAGAPRVWYSWRLLDKVAIALARISAYTGMFTAVPGAIESVRITSSYDAWLPVISPPVGSNALRNDSITWAEKAGVIATATCGAIAPSVRSLAASVW